MSDLSCQDWDETIVLLFPSLKLLTSYGLLSTNNDVLVRNIVKLIGTITQLAKTIAVKKHYV